MTTTVYRLASTDNPGMSRISGESVDTLPRGYYIGWHPRIVRGCPKYPGNPGHSAKGVLYRFVSTDNPGMSRVPGKSMEGHWTTDGVLGQPSLR